MALAKNLSIGERENGANEEQIVRYVYSPGRSDGRQQPYF